MQARFIQRITQGIIFRWIICGCALICALVSGSVAEAAPPLALYLTWQRDPTQTMTVVWLTPAQDTVTQVYFQEEEAPVSEWRTTFGTSYPLPYGYPCRVHVVELTKLQPAMRYRFRLESQGSEHAFTTLSQTLQKPLTFVEGGDCYHDKLADLEKTNTMAARFEPDFVLLGGDLAYAASKKSTGQDDIPRWIAFLQAWTRTMVTSDGRLIPLLVAMGNHDVNGYDNQTPEQAQLFFTLFPLAQRRSSYQLLVGDYLSLVALDSGHSQPIAQQADWLNQVLGATALNSYRFVCYHVPAYPSVRSYHYPISEVIRKVWLPLFDRHLVDIAFEHHDHAYKRTHPLLNNQIVPQGVLYVGDGSWGAKARSPKKKWYLAKTASSRHFIVVTLYPTAAHVKAVSAQGQILDAFEVPRRQRALQASSQIRPTEQL